MLDSYDNSLVRFRSQHCMLGSFKLYICSSQVVVKSTFLDIYIYICACFIMRILCTHE